MTEQAVVKTQDELLSEMRSAVDKGDFKAVSKISSEIAKLVAVQEKTEKDAKLDAVKKLTEDVKKVIRKALKPIYDSGELDPADGVWFSWDFSAGDLQECKLIKGAVRKAGGGGGGGKKFSITTTQLLTDYGAQKMGDSGKTFNEAWAESTDGNKRYNIRIKLLKLAGTS